jgi:hypothetical protein
MSVKASHRLMLPSPSMMGKPSVGLVARCRLIEKQFGRHD